jgi:F0F1-type ATP synthase membrane subunit b/b'
MTDYEKGAADAQQAASRRIEEIDEARALAEKDAAQLRAQLARAEQDLVGARTTASNLLAERERFARHSLALRALLRKNLERTVQSAPREVQPMLAEVVREIDACPEDLDDYAAIVLGKELPDRPNPQ